MEKVIIKLYEAQEGVKMLYILDVINKEAYEHLAGCLKEAFDEICPMYRDNGIPQGKGSFTDCENYVNKHINLADTEALIKELERRGLEIKNNE